MPGWVAKRLGNGLFGLVDVDDPDRSPSVTAAVTAPAFDTFTRILQGQVNNNEEMRVERPSSYMNGFEYVAVGPKDADPADAVWSCVRCTWVNKTKTRFQYRSAISWLDRANGW